MGLQPNTITFLTSTLSTSSLEIENDDIPLESTILWVYFHLKYPQSCINNIPCKENIDLKLQISFTKLSDFLTTIKLDDYNNEQIQLDWCSLIGMCKLLYQMRKKIKIVLFY